LTDTSVVLGSGDEIGWVSGAEDHRSVIEDVVARLELTLISIMWKYAIYLIFCGIPSAPLTEKTYVRKALGCSVGPFQSVGTWKSYMYQDHDSCKGRLRFSDGWFDEREFGEGRGEELIDRFEFEVDEHSTGSMVTE
jgi:hypothetical protein